MQTIVYLILVMTASTGVTTVAIPQANMQQCQINLKAQDHKKTHDPLSSNIYTTARCIVGVR